MDNCLIPGLPDDVAQECLIRVPFQELCVLRSVCHRWRQAIFSTEFHRRRRLAGCNQPVFLFTYKYPKLILTHMKFVYKDKFCLLEPTTGNCYAVGNVSNSTTRLTTEIYDATAVGVGHSIVAINWLGGGIHIYNFLISSWRQGASMPGPPRQGCAYASDGVRCVFICGGYCHDGTISRSVISYDVDEDRWKTLPDMLEGCEAFKVVYNDGILYAFSTQKFDRNFCRMDKLNIKSGEWSVETLKWLCKFRRFPDRLTIGGDGRIYYCHGMKLWVKEGEVWRALLDLPAANAKKGNSLIPWKGGLLITPYLSFCNDILEVRTLELDGDNQKLKWTLHTVDNKDETNMEITLLEI